MNSDRDISEGVWESCKLSFPVIIKTVSGYNDLSKKHNFTSFIKLPIPLKSKRMIGSTQCTNGHLFTCAYACTDFSFSFQMENNETLGAYDFILIS